MPRKGVPYGGAICSLPSAVQSVNGLTGAVKLNAAHIPSDGSSNVQADLDALRASIDGKAAKTEALGTGTALALGGGTGARTLTLAHKTVSGASSSSAVTLPGATHSASGLMTAEQALRLDGKAAKTEALGTGTALALGGGTGARTLTLARKTVSETTSSSAITIPAATYSASGLMTAEQALRLDAALPASTPQVYTAMIPQTDYLDVFLAQYVRIGPHRGLLSFSGHMRDISLPGDVWTLISVDTVMSAMGLTHRRPSAYRTTGWWHYDDGDDHADRYGSGTVCQVSPAGGLELGRFHSGTDIGTWEMSSLGRNRYISVRDVYVEIK